MGLCTLCNEGFPLLDEPTNNTVLKCGKCANRKPGMSAPQLAALNDKPQCAGCGLTSSTFMHPVCNTCVGKLRVADGIPRAILEVFPGIVALLRDEGSTEPEPDLSAAAAALLSSAEEHRATASETRLKTTSLNLLVTGTTQPKSNFLAKMSGKYPALTKAHAVKAEQRMKREEAHYSDDKVRIAGSLWVKDGTKLSQFIETRQTRVFPPTKTTKSAFDDLFGHTVDLLKRVDANLANELNWGNVTPYAHESQSKASSLVTFDKKNPVSALFQEFVDQKFISEAHRKDRKIEVRFVFDWAVLADTVPLDPNSRLSSKVQVASGKASRTRAGGSVTSRAPPSTRSARQSSIPDYTNGTRPSMGPPPVPAFPTSSTAPTTRTSATMPASQAPARRSSLYKSPFRMPWSREPAMTTLEFTHVVASYDFSNGLQVKFKEQSGRETIEVAMFPWKGTPGFIGEGYSKQGIYARFKGKEYVITQPSDEQATQEHVKSVLHAEYALLCMADKFKDAFDELALEERVSTIPDFAFNFNHSILGKLIPSADGGRRLPHLWFIGTLMLPCGPLDPKIKKYTGNDCLGGAPTNDMEKAIHAFAHFSVIYSASNLVFCDLQGVPNGDGVICLFDLQAHTATSASNNCTEYWDLGKKGIANFKKEHAAVCADNWICQKLHLQEAAVERPSSPPKKRRDPKRRNPDQDEDAESQGNASKKFRLSYINT